MTLQEIITSAISSVSGGVYIDDRNISEGQIEAKVNEARAVWCLQQFAVNRNVHPDWIQTFYPEIEQEQQENKCRTVFNCPNVIKFNDLRDGLLYVGSDDYADEFFRITSRSMLSTMMKHQVMRVGRRNYVLYQNGLAELYTVTKVKPPIVNGVFSIPTQVPTYNKNEHQYPIDPAGIDFIEKYLIQSPLMTEIKTPADHVSDGKTITK